MYDLNLPPATLPIAGAILVLAVIISVWLTLSNHRWAVRYRAAYTDPAPHTTPAQPEPHTHWVDGVTIMHTHTNGHAAHDHSHISIPIADYVDYIKTRNRT